MSNELSLQQKLQERISDKIRSSFIEMIPPEEFDKMVAVATDEFVNGPESKRFDLRYPPGKYDGEKVKVPKTYGSHEVPYNPANDPNTLSGMIMQEVRDLGKKTLLDIMSKEPFVGMWTGWGNTASEVVKGAIGANTELFVKSLFEHLVQSAMQNMTNEMRNNPRIY